MTENWLVFLSLGVDDGVISAECDKIMLETHSPKFIDENEHLAQGTLLDKMVAYGLLAPIY